MPEYLAPGVFVEETSFRAKSIEGVSTTTTGFIGPCRYGPIDLEPEVITGLGEFERLYGDRQQLKFIKVDPSTGLPVSDTITGLDQQEVLHNYMWHAVRAFFEEGGKRLYVSRVFMSIGVNNQGYAGAWLARKPTSSHEKDRSIHIRARFPGDLGRMRVRLTLRLGQNILGGLPGKPEIKSLTDGDVVWISDIVNSPLESPPNERGDYYIAESIPDSQTQESTWQFKNILVPGAITSPPDPRSLSTLTAHPDPKLSDKVRILTLTVTVMPTGESDLQPLVYEGLALHPGHKRGGEPDSVFDKFAAKPNSLASARRIPVVFERGVDILDGMDLLHVLFDKKDTLRDKLDTLISTDEDRSIDLLLEDGNDGQRPNADTYKGEADSDKPYKKGLMLLEDVEDIAIIAAPGSTFGYENGYRENAASIINLLIAHAERMRYRIAVLDSGDGQTITDVRAMRARIDSKYAAMYYPWVKVLDPVTRRDIHLPPSGFVSGIYARNDINRGVFKAPANEVVNSAIGFELLLNKSQQEVLNPDGINCLRFFEGRGFRIWGARTISSDPEWKYVNLRRYFAYLERSIDRGTQWAVFEPNGERLWSNVRITIEDFLFNELVSGALLGEKPERAYFVRCDRSTMTQNDLDNGRLVCLIGLAVVKPAEFVIFRIGQWTGDAKR